MDSLASVSASIGPATLAAGLGVVTAETTASTRASRDDLRIMIRAAIVEVAKRGDAVIAAHAGSFALAGRPEVLRVLVTAPAPIRAARIAEERALAQDKAADVVERGDDGRRNYLREFYEIEEELPTHYDMVFSTEVLGAKEVAALIVSAAGHDASAERRPK